MQQQLGDPECPAARYYTVQNGRPCPTLRVASFLQLSFQGHGRTVVSSKMYQKDLPALFSERFPIQWCRYHDFAVISCFSFRSCHIFVTVMIKSGHELGLQGSGSCVNPGR